MNKMDAQTSSKMKQWFSVDIRAGASDYIKPEYSLSFNSTDVKKQAPSMSSADYIALTETHD